MMLHRLFIYPIYSSLLAVTILLSGCELNEEDTEKAKDPAPYHADISVTPYGIPHITATDWGSLGYGYGYHFASDNLCAMADHLLTIRGRRSAHFGKQGKQASNYPSDVIANYLLSEQRMQEEWRIQDERIQQLATGYATGYNRYLQELPAKRHESCRSAPWLQPMKPLDVMRTMIYFNYLASLAQPKMAQAIAPVDVAPVENKVPHAHTPQQPGGNSWGLGFDASQTGRSILVGNPHSPWHGPNRFYQAHLKIPGELNVMGVSIFGSPLIHLGFNEKVAWTHTTSNAIRYTPYELTLKKDDTSKYLFDDLWLPIRSEEVTLEVLDTGGELRQLTHWLHFTEYGILLDLHLLGDDATIRQHPDNKAYALRDAATGNNRSTTQALAMLTAENLDTFIASLEKHVGLSFVNTIAASPKGDVFYGDLTTTPYLTDKQLTDCQPSRTGYNLSVALGNRYNNGQPIPVLDGSRSACQWTVSPESKQPGLLPPSMLAQLRTRDYVANSNDSYWLTNPTQPLTGKLEIMGGEEYPISLRSQISLTMIDERKRNIDGKGKRTRFSLENLKKIVLSSRSVIGERYADDIISLCPATKKAKEGTLKQGCDILKSWNKTYEIDDSGGFLFNHIWRHIRSFNQLISVPFNYLQPLTTPRSLNIENKKTNQEILSYIQEAVGFFLRNELNPNAPHSTMRYVVRNGKEIPIPGATTDTGSFNTANGIFTANVGWSEIASGNSYIQIVTWDKKQQIQAEAILTYSQSTDPANPHFSDQTELYSKGGWVKLPFSDEEVAATKISAYSLSGERATSN